MAEETLQDLWNKHSVLHGMSQTKFAKAYLIHRPTFGLWLRGKNGSPNSEAAVKAWLDSIGVPWRPFVAPIIRPVSKLGTIQIKTAPEHLPSIPFGTGRVLFTDRESFHSYLGVASQNPRCFIVWISANLPKDMDRSVDVSNILAIPFTDFAFALEAGRLNALLPASIEFGFFTTRDVLEIVDQIHALTGRRCFIFDEEDELLPWLTSHRGELDFEGEGDQGPLYLESNRRITWELERYEQLDITAISPTTSREDFDLWMNGNFASWELESEARRYLAMVPPPARFLPEIEPNTRTIYFVDGDNVQKGRMNALDLSLGDDAKILWFFVRSRPQNDSPRIVLIEPFNRTRDASDIDICLYSLYLEWRVPEEVNFVFITNDHFAGLLVGLLRTLSSRQHDIYQIDNSLEFIPSKQ